MSRRGRPPGTTKAFRDDPDRFAVALAAVLIRIHGHPTEKATRLVAAWFHARMIDVTRRRDGMLQIGFAFASTTPDGKADTIRKKLDRVRSEADLNLLATLAAAWELALNGQHLPFGQLRDMIRITAEMAGEPDFGSMLLMAMISPRNWFAGLFSDSEAPRDVIDGRPRCYTARRRP